jgi:trehalose 6-phosphate synthase/phosphatase
MGAHGLWLRPPHGEWAMTANLSNTWKNSVRHVLDLYTDRMPGSFIEEKDYSLAFHYRQCDPDMIEVKLSEVREAISSMTHSMSVSLQDGNKVFEVKDGRVNKGYGASLLIQNGNYDFILGAGDD